MRLEDLIDKMIPSDAETRLPCFSNICTLNDLNMSSYYIKDLQGLMKITNSFSETDDVNIIIKWLRKENSAAVKELEIKVIEAYFSNPIVIQKLAGSAATLYPNKKILPEINFEVLEPVLDLDERLFLDGK